VAIEQCKCITESDDPMFETVPIEDRIVELQRELPLRCVKAEVDTIELEEQGNLRVSRLQPRIQRRESSYHFRG